MTTQSTDQPDGDDQESTTWELFDEIERLRAENERLRAALLTYGAHTGMCGYLGEPYPHGYHCVCGLYDIIDAGEHLAALG